MSSRSLLVRAPRSGVAHAHREHLALPLNRSRWTRSTTLALATALVAGSVADPSEAGAQHRLSVAFTMTEPRGEGGRDIDTFDGPGLTYVHDVGSGRRWALGFAGAGGTYGSADRPLSVPFPDLRARSHNRVGTYVGILQYKLASGAVQPYLQAAAGYGEFLTETEITCEDCTQGLLFIVEDLRDASFVGGGSAGVLTRIHQRERTRLDGSPDDPLRLDLELAVRWLRGGTVRFLSDDPTFDEDGTLLADSIEEAPLELLQYQIGLSVAW